jgi:hypothetical protein
VHDKDVVIHDAIRAFEVGDIVEYIGLDGVQIPKGLICPLGKKGTWGVVTNVYADPDLCSVDFGTLASTYPASALTLVKPAQ